MNWLLCDIVGTGTETDPLRPAIRDYPGGYSETVTFEQRGKSLVRCDYQPAFDSDPRIQKISKSLFAGEIPDDGEDDGEESPALALKVTRRALLENLLAEDDAFNAHGPSLMGTLAPGISGRAIDRLAQLGLVHSAVTPSTKVEDILREVLPQIPARVLPRLTSPGGTFTDDFDGEGSTVDLASHTPSGGTAWTRQGGSVDDLQVTTDGVVTSNGAAPYLCDDQGIADQYTQYTLASGIVATTFMLSRYSDSNNYFGTRYDPGVSEVRLFTKISGSFTERGSFAHADTAGDVVKTEHDGDNTDVYLDTGSGFSQIIGPYNSTFNNTATRQGLGGSSFTTGISCTAFEAGTLGAPPGGNTLYPAAAMLGL